MASIDIREEYINIAGKQGIFGAAGGTLAYGYARVSTAHQAEEGASGLPRQLRHLHLAAQRANLQIPYDFLYVDDGYSGFEFVERPALTQLRYDIRTFKRAEHLVVEEIDRLSRNADWHQGFLLEELARRKVTVHFYADPGSELERYIRGYMAQESMRKEIERMRQGKIYKAMDGRVTATRAAYGYRITDPKDSRYEIREDEARIVRMVYNWLTEERRTLHYVADRLNEMGVPGRRGGKWCPGTLLNMVKNEVYKGWYIANRRTYEIAGYTEDGKPKRTWRMRPEKEWIWVPVPAIVTPEQWEEAHEVLASNRTYASRNANRPVNWLLSGLVECAVCNYAYRVSWGQEKPHDPEAQLRYYHCGGRWSARAKSLGIACRSPYVRAEVLETTVWHEIEKLILEPAQVLKVLEQDFVANRVDEQAHQMQYLDRQIVELTKQRSRWDAAYASGVLELEDYQEKVSIVRAKQTELQQSKAVLEAEYEELKSQQDLHGEIVRRLEGLRSGVDTDLPETLKRQLMTTLVDKILLNSETGEGTIFGAVPPIRFVLSSNRI